MRFYVPFTDEIEVEYADRQIWFYKLNREFLKIVDYFVKWSDNLFCSICDRNHTSVSGLRNCLFYHRTQTINHFIDYELVEASEK